MKYISICMPTSEVRGKGVFFLKQTFDILKEQTFTDFDIVISDHSKNDLIEKLCIEYKDKLDIKYYRNTENYGISSANTNNAIKKAEGKLIKILFTDDFLFSKNSLKEISENFDLEKDHWLVTACTHTENGADFFKPLIPRYTNRIHLGKNTIGCPSVLTIKNENPILLDEKLIWIMDCDHYRRYYDAYGKPKIVNTIGVAIRLGDHQMTNIDSTIELRIKEYAYMLKKYEKGLSYSYNKIIGFLKLNVYLKLVRFFSKSKKI